MSDLLLAPGARLVHIGPQKTGSTALQLALFQARDELIEHGAYCPGGGYRRRRAGWALGLNGRPAGTQPPPIELWDRLANEVAGVGELRACISNEAFAHANHEQALKIVTDLGGDAVHVVAVARRLDRYLPSLWQERVKASEARTFEEWLEVALHGDDSIWDYRNVWNGHDIDALVRRWTDVVGPDRFTLIVSDDKDHGFIPRTFEQMLGLPEGLLRPSGGRDNRSLNVVEAELIRQINAEVLARGIRGDRYRELIRKGLTNRILESEGAIPGPRIPIPAWAADEIRALSDRRVESVRHLKVRVLGDPELLRMPADSGATEIDLSALTVPLSGVTDAVAATLEKMIEQLDRVPS